MDDAGTAYAAGLFEGEGSVCLCGGYPRVEINITDREPLERIQATLGGQLYGPYKRPGRKDCHFWMLYGWEGVEHAYEQLRALLSPRRVEQFAAVLALAPPAEDRGRWAQRATHCQRGHPFDDANTGRQASGHRYCKACRRLRGRKDWAKRGSTRRRARRSTSSPPA